ncbi:hypothetical protein CYMTET_32749 [Cymbomonas tetramitiformis]|uniref:Uncharacterized protein n=1 Tax=Cymbomonas tetramitiformis TaxID=36881 RepID=A0AAE0KRX3_9CHLO|nr:hypothetical protein CYMTET_32749 [Cymbomonas tetramitiformis]
MNASLPSPDGDGSKPSMDGERKTARMKRSMSFFQHGAKPAASADHQAIAVAQANASRQFELLETRISTNADYQTAKIERLEKQLDQLQKSVNHMMTALEIPDVSE